MSLLQHSHTFEEMIDYGLVKFNVPEIERKYVKSIITTNKRQYVSDKKALRNLIGSIETKIPIDAFFNWFDNSWKLYLLPTEPLFDSKVSAYS